MVYVLATTATMSQSIPSTSRPNPLSYEVGRSSGSGAGSPQLLTPLGTPPAQSALAGTGQHDDAGLKQLFAKMEANRDRDLHQGPGSAAPAGAGTDGRRKSFGATEGGARPPRRTSFLESLPFRQGFSFSPVATPPLPPQDHATTGARPPALSSLSMTPTASGASQAEQHAYVHGSTLDPLVRPAVNEGDRTQSMPASPVQRSKTMSTPKGQMSRELREFQQCAAQLREKRHFDPSKEPRLFGLL